VVTEITPVQAGQQVVITAYTASAPQIVQGTSAVGGVPTVICYSTSSQPCMAPRPGGQCPPQGLNEWGVFHLGAFNLS
jgi:hypothetical protein